MRKLGFKVHRLYGRYDLPVSWIESQTDLSLNPSHATDWLGDLGLIV